MFGRRYLISIVKEDRVILAMTEDIALIQTRLSGETYKRAATLFDKNY